MKRPETSSKVQKNLFSILIGMLNERRVHAEAAPVCLPWLIDPLCCTAVSGCGFRPVGYLARCSNEDVSEDR